MKMASRYKIARKKLSALIFRRLPQVHIFGTLSLAVSHTLHEILLLLLPLSRFSFGTYLQCLRLRTRSGADCKRTEPPGYHSFLRGNSDGGGGTAAGWYQGGNLGAGLYPPGTVLYADHLRQQKAGYQDQDKKHNRVFYQQAS